MAGGRLTKRGLWLGVVLAACGGRTLDDGAFGAPRTSNGNSDGTCRYNGVTVANGTLVADPCVCFCDSGQFQCQSGCDGPSSNVAGASAAGAAPIVAGGPSFAGGTAAGAPSGGAASGGFTGVAGAPGYTCGPAQRASGQQPLIDDMEDDNGQIAMLEGRAGPWFTYNDGTPGAVQFPPSSSPLFPLEMEMDPLSGGRFVRSTSASGFGTWGAGMGLSLSRGCPYDASVYQGVRIFARADRPMILHVLFPTADTNPPSAGGTCQELTGHSCYDAYQTQVTLDSSWQKFYLDFGPLYQQGWGQPVVFDPRK